MGAKGLKTILYEIDVRKALPPTNPLPDHWRPQTRADCENLPMPCPYVGCRYHLYLEVSRQGAITLNFPNIGLNEMPATCALQVAADVSPLTIEAVAAYLNITRQRANQIQITAQRKIACRLPVDDS